MEPAWTWAMGLLGLQGHLLLHERAHEHTGERITRWTREAPSWRQWTTWLLRPRGPWREQMGESTVGVHVIEPESDGSFFPWDYISLSVRCTKCFPKMNNQLPKLLWASVVSIAQFSFPRLD